jgi:hypothetical protein
VTDGARIAVLDFTGFTHGPALYDFMKFWMKLDDFRFGPFFGATRVAGWQAAFTEGYGGGDLGGPLARFLALANRLDKLSEALDGPAARRSPRGLLARRWYDGQLRALCAAVTGAPEGAR